MRKILSIVLFGLISIITPSTISAEPTSLLCDSTLRLDYIFGGNADRLTVLLDRQKKYAGWAGRRHHLSDLPLRGNGAITVTDTLTGDTLYRTSFSTLFREWQETDEARQTSRAFQNTFLVPLPVRPARITLDLYNNRHEVAASNTHIYSPGDILVKRAGAVNPAPYRVIHQGGDPKEVIDVAILAEGFTPDEMDEFYGKAEEAVDAIFSHEPFKSRRNAFNFYAVASPSKDSGVTVPRYNEWKDTSFGSNFDTFYSDRYLTSANIYDIHDAAEAVPYEHLIVLAKSPVYGGGGIYNALTLTTTGHDKFRPVVVHEFGHSFGGLADEYFYEVDEMNDSYPLDLEPWEPNITTLVDFGSKWQSLIKKGTPIPTDPKDYEKYPVGVYEGGGYSFKGVYRPADRCRMRDNDWPVFCPACQRSLLTLIDFYTRP